jgi:hypothetical protein
VGERENEGKGVLRYMVSKYVNIIMYSPAQLLYVNRNLKMEKISPH